MVRLYGTNISHVYVITFKETTSYYTMSVHIASRTIFIHIKWDVRAYFMEYVCGDSLAYVDKYIYGHTIYKIVCYSYILDHIGHLSIKSS